MNHIKAFNQNHAFLVPSAASTLQAVWNGSVKWEPEDRVVASIGSVRTIQKLYIAFNFT